MAYQTGTVNSLADIQTVIRVFLVDNGWTWDSSSNTIYKGTVFIEMTVTALRVEIRGKTALGSATGGYAAVGRMSPSIPGYAVTFPSTYWLFLNDDEFCFVVNYDVTRYQYITFGKSTIDLSGTGGTGTYLSGTNNEGYLPTYNPPIFTSPDGTVDARGTGFTATAAAPFFVRLAANIELADHVHTGMSASPWSLLNEGKSVGNAYQGNLLAVLPNAWNGESPLLPIRAYKLLTESKVALVLDLQHARHCRIDNFNDQEIITIGADQWQVFPHHRRNTTDRNGWGAIDHTGTFGWAIRKVV